MAKNLMADFSVFPDFTTADLPAFFKTVSVLSVPVLKGEAFGLYQLEALASGVPIVQPGLGAFPEIVNLSGAGILFNPNTPEKLAEALASLLSDQQRLEEMSLRGRKAVDEHFNSAILAGRMVDVYQEVIQRYAGRT